MSKRIAIVVVSVIVVGSIAYLLDVHHYIKFYATPSQAIPDSATTSERLVGNYYFGDGLGVNQSLRLQPDGKFHCQWSGCMGDYGSSSGTWAVEGDKLIVSTSEAEGMFIRSPLENMTILQHDGKPHLLEDDWRSFIDEFGDDAIPDATFSPTD